MNWLRKEKIICDSNQVETTVTNIGAQYKTNLIMLNHQPLPNEQYCVEVWFNFKSQTNVIVVYLYQAECDEEKIYD